MFSILRGKVYLRYFLNGLKDTAVLYILIEYDHDLLYILCNMSNRRDSVICQTGETVFHRGSWKYDAQRSIFDEIRGVWIADETLSRVFDVSSQLKQKLRSKQRSKIVKIYAN